MKERESAKPKSDEEIKIGHFTLREVLPEDGKSLLKKGQIIKINTPQGFALAQLEEPTTTIYRVALKHFHTPQQYNGKVCYWAFDHCILDKAGTVIAVEKRVWLENTDKDNQAKAWAAFNWYIEQDQARIKKLRAETRPVRLEGEKKDVAEAEWKIIAKVFPRTVALLLRAQAAAEPERDALQREASETYKLETAARAGIILDATNKPKEITALAKALKQERRWYDEVDVFLAANWMPKQYAALTAKELADVIRRGTGHRLSPAAIKKRRERLGLVTKRPTGPRQRVE